ncbi:hypothetical protein [Methylomarinum vadi]|uniref:hypothetical protein n=1 Tax=Methylomarinum vadi TaxID=438855 RepID=UPI0004DECDE1|nr:hypothetical protein [Methylomarinum vadi]
MNSSIDELLGKIKTLEQELIEQIQDQHQEFAYEIRKKRIFFERKVILQQKRYLQQLLDYLREAPLKHILSAPIIWSVLPAALFLDLVVSLYQATCFPIYGIPKVKRSEYIVFDRQFLNYLNLIEKFNCAYCSYFNGVIAYIQEIAARTEQFWCPIKHARRISMLHSRYRYFLSYGDAKSYRNDKEQIRRNFEDLIN